MSGERGSGTVVAAALCACLLTLTVAATAVVAAVLGAHRAREAADMGAIAAARLVVAGDAEAACAAAAEIVARDGGRIAQCSVAGRVVQVGVTVRTARGLPAASAVARAGPRQPGPEAGSPEEEGPQGRAHPGVGEGAG